MQILQDYSNISQIYKSQHDNSQRTTSYYTAIHIPTNQKVFIKKINLHSERYIEYATEKYILKEFSDPYLICPVDIFELEDYGYIISPFSKGGDLFDLITGESWNINDRDLKTFAYHLLKLIRNFNHHGFIFRDLKPENIIVELSKFNPDRFHVIDVASTYCRLTANFPNFRCTANYSPPEYYYYNVFSENYDTWSVGIILYVMVVRCFPVQYQECGPKEVIEIVSNDKILFKDDEWNLISDEMKKLISMLLTFDCMKRPTADEVLRMPIFTSFIANEQRNCAW
ncbi:hypothetical protein TRFO_36340 [Tritrichomonas foetus]|uniref:Protein kinase domain-containing protein n=1 Tax=Tritrichomonas foetus TaxID=1144522 RepID=A0A1J4JJR0_9EUKA|nr:hypothetical protein TRFO_36340 [Tritrichomonas foetus]|eukprot:OHS97476.1 hypothetical protein TRFO_36340 [Tritrichomonas foetus]